MKKMVIIVIMAFSVSASASHVVRASMLKKEDPTVCFGTSLSPFCGECLINGRLGFRMGGAQGACMPCY